jgi:type III pantothenate kinase
MRNYIGVDIGNSGLRCSVLDVANQQLGATRALCWGHAGQRSPQSELTAYRPSDPGWKTEIVEFVAKQLQKSAKEPTVWLLSSVRRDAARILSDQIAVMQGHSLCLLNDRSLPLSIEVDYPEKVGVDRLLAAYAAAEASQERPLIVVQAGTAVTVDLLQLVGSERQSAETFMGGAILPGIPLMLRMMGTGTDMLPANLRADDLTNLPSLPGRSTQEAMICGAAACLIGGVNHLIQRYREQLGARVPVILSGGDGFRVAPHLDSPVIVREQLVQHGILRLAIAHQSGEMPLMGLDNALES